MQMDLLTHVVWRVCVCVRRVYVCVCVRVCLCACRQKLSDSMADKVKKYIIVEKKSASYYT